MFCLYSRSKFDSFFEYEFKEKISLFGYKSGYIPFLLSDILESDDSEPFKWHLDVNKELNKDASIQEKKVIVIDMKPNNNYSHATLFDLTDVWGFSSFNWTPLLFRLKVLVLNGNGLTHGKERIIIDCNDNLETVFTFSHAQGTIQNGKIAGTWKAPNPSPTNSAFLWPEVLRYFYCKISNNP